jgi:23S rRNA (uracil1939-C5)-methyltransferase
MLYGGAAIGRHEGQAVFVTGGLPGETVRVQIDEEHRRFLRATVIDAIDPSPDRVAPRCPHFGFTDEACGGCQWQHITYEAQLRYKTAIVREQLQRLGGVSDPPVRDILPSPVVWAYRNHAQFHRASDGRPGLQAAQSHRVVPLNECPIIEPPLQAWLQANRSLGQYEPRLSVRCSNAPDRPERPDRSTAATTFVINAVPLRVSAESFFQVNTSLIETLIDQVLARLELRGDEIVLDAYCGVGLFSRFIAPHAGRIIGIESSRSALEDARRNLATFDHVEWHLGRVEEVLPILPGSIAVAVLDPPRAGCTPAVIDALIARQLARVVYVSCDPATLARDVKNLIAGGYRLIEAQPIDLFPHTYHVETIAWLRWAGEAET